MEQHKTLATFVLVLGLMVCTAKVSEAAPMGTAWTYQGRLMEDNNPAGGPYDFEFRLFDDPCTGTQQGSTIDFNDLDVIDGHFTVELDFGSDVFNGDARWLETTVSDANGSDLCTLRPRIEVTPVPYALQTRGIFVDDSGNVGIGTTNPIQKLDVQGTIRMSSTTAAEIDISSEPGYNQIYSYGGDHLVLNTAGNVGIGTTTPSSKLDVLGTVSFTTQHDTRAPGLRITRLKAPPTIGSRNMEIDATSINAYNIDVSAQGDTLNLNNDSDGHILLVEGGGNVGIGTTDPKAGLHINRAGDWGSLAISNKNINITYGETHFDYPDEKNYIRGTTIIADTGGNVGIGTTTPAAKLDVVGRIRISNAAGDPVVEMGEGLDYAEGFDIAAEDNIEPGSVLLIDADNPGKLALSNAAYDRKVAGIVAGGKGLSSGVRLGAGQFDYDVALAGRVYCKVDATKEAVQAGDLLTTSATPGYAMKAVDYTRSHGAILGKAMESLEKGQKGQILVLVTLQ